MNAIELIRKHDPNNLGEFSNSDYIEMFAYAKGLESELEQIQSLKDENQKLFKESLVFQQFIEWYSGMDSDKIAKAFIRFKKELTKEQ